MKNQHKQISDAAKAVIKTLILIINGNIHDDYYLTASDSLADKKSTRQNVAIQVRYIFYVILTCNCNLLDNFKDMFHVGPFD